MATSRTILLVSALVAFGLPALFADRIVFVDGMELEGTVLQQGEIDVTVRVEPGKIRLLKSRIDRIELDIDARLQEMPKKEGASNTKDYLALAKLCEEYNHEEGLMKCLESVKENEDLPLEKLLQLAGLYEKRNMKEQYKNVLYRYMELNPGRKDIRDRLDALEAETRRAEEEKGKKEEEEARKLAEEQEQVRKEQDAKEQVEMAERREALMEYFKDRELKPDMIAKKEKEELEAPNEVPEEAPKETPEKKAEEPEKIVKTETEAKETTGTKVADEGKEKKPEAEPKEGQPGANEGLEADKEWGVQNWGNPAKLEITDQGGEAKNLLLQLTFTPGDKDKSAIGLNYPNDLSTTQEIQFDAFNGSQAPVSIAIAIQTMPGWVYYESYATTIKPDKWALKKSIKVNSSKFKCAESNWEHKSEVKNLKNTVKIYFLVYQKAAGHIFLDNVKFVAAEAGEKAEGAEKAEKGAEGAEEK
jgi:hypothetical protein